MNYTLSQFNRLYTTKGLHKEQTYTFVSRQDANKAADNLRANTLWIVEWVGPQQFIVY